MLPYKGYGVCAHAVTAITVTVFTAFLLNWYNSKRKRNRIPEKWRPVGKVTSLFMYPLKSGRRVSLDSAQCSPTGIRQITEPGKYQLGDRTLVVYKESSKECRTARTNPKLVLIEVAVDDDDYLVINAPGMDTLRLNVANILDKSRKDRREEVLSLFVDDRLDIVDCGDQAAEWVTKYLMEDGSSESRFGLYDGRWRMNQILLKLKPAYPTLTDSSTGIYSDLTSFMMMNQASVDDIASRVSDTNVSVHNFRPNILVSDENLPPFDEDNWEYVKVGDVIFKNVKACTRCMFTTVDPQTGVRNQNMEPLKTLRTYRVVEDLIKTELEKNAPIMGIHLGLISGGRINVGDQVSVSVRE